MQKGAKKKGVHRTPFFVGTLIPCNHQIGLIFPIFIEETWPVSLRIGLYFLALCYRSYHNPNFCPNYDDHDDCEDQYHNCQMISHGLEVILIDRLHLSFVAVFIVADIFMCSIDAITSKTKVFSLIVVVYHVCSSVLSARVKWMMMQNFFLKEFLISC